MIIGISGKIGSGKDTVGKIIQYLTAKDKSDKAVGLLKCGLSIEGYHDSDWQIKKFATKLKQIVSILTGISLEDLEKEEVKNALLGEQWVRYGFADGFYRYLAGSLEGETVMNNKECTKERYETELKTNWQTAYKIEYTPRILLQYIGTDLFRKQLLENIWVNALFSDYIEAIDMTPNSARTSGINVRSLGYPNWIITDLRFPNELKAVKDRGGIAIRVFRTEELKDNSAHISETALDNAKFDIYINNSGTIDELVEKVEYHLKQLKII